MEKVNLFIHKNFNSIFDIINTRNPLYNEKGILLLTKDLFLKTDNEKLNILRSKFKETVVIEDFLNLPFNRLNVSKIVSIGFSDVTRYSKLYEKIGSTNSHTKNFILIEFHEVNDAIN